MKITYLVLKSFVLQPHHILHIYHRRNFLQRRYRRTYLRCSTKLFDSTLQNFNHEQLSAVRSTVDATGLVELLPDQSQLPIS